MNIWQQHKWFLGIWPLGRNPAVVERCLPPVCINFAVRPVANGKFSFPESGLQVQDYEWFGANNTGFTLRVVHNGIDKAIFQ